MRTSRRALPGFTLAVLSLLPLPTLGQEAVGPLELIQTFDGFRGSAVTTSAVAGPLAFFTVKGAYTFQTFWRSDGTREGTFQIGPRNPVAPQEFLRFWTSHGDLVYFTWALSEAPEDRALWRSDGSDAGTFPVTRGLSLAIDTDSGDLPTSLPVPETGLVFSSAGPRSASPDFELWATDGTVEGTRLVKEINPEGPSNPSRMVAFGGQLFFLADTPEGRELWRSDGTPEGTERVADFHETGEGIVPMVQTGGALFLLTETASGVEVWRSDGTEAGTTRVLELPAPRRLGRYLTAGDRLFVVVHDERQITEIWAVDAATGETVRVLQAPTLADFDPVAFGDRLAFALADGHGREPWVSDGTPDGTHRLADLCPGPCDSFPDLLGTYGGRVVLSATDGVSGREPWLSNGTAAGTFPLGDLCPGECAPFFERVVEHEGWLLLHDSESLWASDGTREGTWRVRYFSGVTHWMLLPGRVLFANQEYFLGVRGALWSLPLGAAPPPGDWIASNRVPGFRFKVRIAGTIPGRPEPACIAETLCVSGARPGRSEVFLRVVGPRPNGRLWPTLVKFTTSLVEVWVQQTATGEVRTYRLNASGADGSRLPGVVDLEGFAPAEEAPEPAPMSENVEAEPPPPGGWIVSEAFPGFRFKARITAGGPSRPVRKEPCIAETLCLSGALRGRPELFVRIVGPRPNGYLWPTLVRFTTSRVEVWIEQTRTGTVRYYRLNELPQDSSDLSGLFDREGFRR